MKRLRPMSSNSVEVTCPSLLQACEHSDSELVQIYFNAGITVEQLNAQDQTGKVKNFQTLFQISFFILIEIKILLIN